VIDPFVGSGSLIVAAAQFGSSVVGSDIDYLMIHAKNKSSRVGQKKRAKGEHLKGKVVRLKV
jgi:tRNA (guanine10-N2)-methyltransferase